MALFLMDPALMHSNDIYDIFKSKLPDYFTLRNATVNIIFI